MVRPAQPRQPAPRPHWNIDDILARIDLDHLLDELTQPAKTTSRPRRWHCPVPGHDDHHPSVTTHTDARGHQRWRCWSGDDTHRGDAIDLVAITQGLNARDAIDWLAHRAGLHPERPLPPLAPRRRRPPPAPTIVPLDPIVRDYVHACAQHLWTPAGTPIRDWLISTRHLNPEVLRTHHVGADPGARVMPRAPGLPRGTHAAATFPALDPHGQIRYVQTRYLHPDDGHKYDNPASRLGTNPRLAWTIPTRHPTPGLLLVCEGIPDALTAAQHGYLAVGVLGAQAPDHRVAVHLANRASSDQLHLVAIVDHDTAGHAWGTRLTQLLAEHAQPVTIVEPPMPGMDLNTWAIHDPHWIDALAHLSTVEPDTPHTSRPPAAITPVPTVPTVDVTD